MSSTTTYLITGANRGIGKGLASALLLRPSTTVIVLVRDPNHPTSQSLNSLPKGQNSRLLVEKYDAAVDGSAARAIKSLVSSHSITSLDVVVANSGILNSHGPSTSATPAELIEHLTVNAIAPLTLFGATQPLLSKSKNPKFFTISSAVGSNGQLEAYQGLPIMPYGMSKAAVNFAMRKLHFEFPDIIVEPLQPGWVQTEMGGNAAEIAGVKEGAPLTLEQSVGGLLKQFDIATRETSGRFWAWDGEEIPW